MQEPVFKTKRGGWFGPIRLGPDYLKDVERRAKRMEAAAGEQPKDRRQMRLPFKEAK